MLFAIITSLFLAGFYCFGWAIKRLSLLDQRHPQLILVESAPEAPKPKLTRLGRPIEEINLGNRPSKFSDPKTATAKR